MSTPGLGSFVVPEGPQRRYTDTVVGIGHASDDKRPSTEQRIRGGAGRRSACRSDGAVPERFVTAASAGMPRSRQIDSLTSSNMVRPGRVFPGLPTVPGPPGERLQSRSPIPCSEPPLIRPSLRNGRSVSSPSRTRNSSVASSGSESPDLLVPAHLRTADSAAFVSDELKAPLWLCRGMSRPERPRGGPFVGAPAERCLPIRVRVLRSLQQWSQRKRSMPASSPASSAIDVKEGLIGASGRFASEARQLSNPLDE